MTKHQLRLSIRSLVLLAFYVSSSVLGYTQTTDYRAKLAEIDAYAQKAQRDWDVPGMAIAIVKDDRVIFAKGYGVREIGKPEKVDENTIFAIASNTKAFTTAALAILIDEGKIKSWDDRVLLYLPEFQMPDAYVTRELTIRDLVSHRSGLGAYNGDAYLWDSILPTDELLRRVRFLKPKNGFRSAFGYTQVAYMAAARIVEKVSGRSWGQFVRERILTPLGMTNTKTSVREFKPADNLAAPHNRSGGKGLRVIRYENVDRMRGAAGLNSSVAEMSKWLRLQLGLGTFEGKRIFSPAQSWAMRQPSIFQPIPEANASFIPSRHFNGYGMGWFVSDYQGRKLVSHGGELEGMFSQTAMMPEEDLGLVILTNSESQLALALRFKIFDVFVGAPKRDWSADYLERDRKAKAAAEEEDRKIVAARIPNTKTSLPLGDYAGTYGGDLDSVSITEENGKLVLRMPEAPTFVADLEHWHYDTFQIHWRESVVVNFPRQFATFSIDRNGKPDELKISHAEESELHRIKK